MEVRKKVAGLLTEAGEDLPLPWPMAMLLVGFEYRANLCARPHPFSEAFKKRGLSRTEASRCTFASFQGYLEVFQASFRVLTELSFVIGGLLNHSRGSFPILSTDPNLSRKPPNIQEKGRSVFENDG